MRALFESAASARLLIGAVHAGSPKRECWDDLRLRRRLMVRQAYVRSISRPVGFQQMQSVDARRDWPPRFRACDRRNSIRAATLAWFAAYNLALSSTAVTTDDQIDG